MVSFDSITIFIDLNISFFKSYFFHLFLVNFFLFINFSSFLFICLKFLKPMLISLLFVCCYSSWPSLHPFLREGLPTKSKQVIHSNLIKHSFFCFLITSLELAFDSIEICKRYKCLCLCFGELILMIAS